MSRRHHHHNIQPYDYERFNPHPRERDQTQHHQTRGIEYQDDSLSSINSDEDTYLHQNPHVNKEKKGNFFRDKNEGPSKQSKQEKPSNSDNYHQNQKEVKTQTTSSNPDQTAERLARLETMLEQLIKRDTKPSQKAASPAHNARNVSNTLNVPEKTETSKEEQFRLNPRRHDFTTSMWINKIQEVSIQNNWSEKSVIQYMGSQMSGIIKAWYNSLPNYDYTWPEWKIMITKIFPDNTDFVTTLKRLVTRLKQSDETITTYYFSKMYLIEACKITGEDAVSCLIDGLNNQDIQEQARSHNFLTPESLYSQFLMVLPDYTVDYSPSIAPTTETVLNNWYYQEQQPVVEQDEEVLIPQEEVFEYEKDPRSVEFEYHNQGNPEFQNEGNILSKRTMPVHSRLDKRFIKPNNFRPHNNIPLAARVCTVCQKRGHLTRNCRKNKDKIMCSMLLSDTSKSCFFKECTINNQKLAAFIDTGCTTVTIRQQEAEKLDLKLRPLPNWIQVYGGGFVKVLGEVDIVVGVDSVKAPVRAVVVPNSVQDVSVIIGQAFLVRKNVEMTLQNETLKMSEAN